MTRFVSLTGWRKALVTAAVAMVAFTFILVQSASAQDGTCEVKVGGVKLEPFTETIPGTTVKFNMVPIPEGKINIGGKSFDINPIWMAETEVQWDAFDMYAYGLDLKAEGKEPGSDDIIRPSKPYGAPDRGFGHQGYAALSMTYGAATEFARWLSVKTGHNYRVATEAEWQYACAAGGAKDDTPLEERAWFAENSENKTQPIMSKKPNAFGLHDMMGNAMEWCSNPDDPEVAVNACGGSYLTPKAELTCARKDAFDPDVWQETDPQIPKSVFWLTDATWIGIRVVRDPSGE